jgi:hypothetical protein
VPSILVNVEEASSMNAVKKNDDGHGHPVWHVPTILPPEADSTEAITTDGESVPDDAQDTQAKTNQVPIEEIGDDRSNRSTRGLNDTNLNESTILTNGGPTPVTFRYVHGHFHELISK